MSGVMDAQAWDTQNPERSIDAVAREMKDCILGKAGYIDITMFAAIFIQMNSR